VTLTNYLDDLGLGGIIMCINVGNTEIELYVVRWNQQALDRNKC
jgi:hypothetical protein